MGQHRFHYSQWCSLEITASFPKLAPYSAGYPSNKLYIKNIDKQVTSRQIAEVFGRFATTAGLDSKGGNLAAANLMSVGEFETNRVKLFHSGKMRGQCFVEFDTVGEAAECLAACNGRWLGDKPIVVMFGKA